MTDEPEATENDFAAFEAAATEDAPPPEAKEPETPAEGEEARTEDDETPAVNDEAAEPEGDEPEGDDKPEKRRSKPAHTRIAELTAKMREFERRAIDAEARAASTPPAAPVELTRPDPNDEKYEFGEADPQYLEDVMDYKVEVKLAERAKSADTEAQRTAAVEAVTALDEGWEAQATKGAEKYNDFDKVVLESAAAGEWACPPMVAAAISSSEVGSDVAYHLAKNPDQAEAIAAQLEVDPIAAATRFGTIEGGFMDAKPVRPPANAHPLDKALYAGRMLGFIDKAKPDPVKLTNAPEPPRHNVRGGAGKFEVGADTSDFAAFERKVNAR